MEQKTCKQCQKEFVVEDEDLAFFKKISPLFVGKKYLVSPPTLCPECRLRRRLSFRNVRKLYKRKSEISGKDLISCYAPNFGFKVISTEEFESDEFDAKKYGRDFDFNRPFFEQFKDLMRNVPRPHATISSGTLKNAEFVNGASFTKNAYMSFNLVGDEDVYYCDSLFHSKDCVDCLYSLKIENCYECIDSRNLYGCFYCLDCDNSHELYFCHNMNSCRNCFGCSSLNNKQYYIYNKKVTKDEFEKFMHDFKFTPDAINEAIQKARELDLKQPHKFARLINCEDCTGNYLTNAKNCKTCFRCTDVENVKYGLTLDGSVKDSMDVSLIYNNFELGLENLISGHDSYNILFSSQCHTNCRDIYYSDCCYRGNKNLFGCIGLTNSQYCILNKQYSKEEYEVLVPKIINHMQRAGEWGEFFPMSLSPYGYNETLGGDMFPLKKEEAEKAGANWQDDSFDIKYDGPFYEPKPIADYDPSKNSDAKAQIDLALKGIIKCSKSGRPFRIIAQELAFYIKHGLPIPTIHPELRYKKRYTKTMPAILYRRQCTYEEQGHDHEGRCKNEFETTYAPDRPEKVYCEECYQKSVI